MSRKTYLFERYRIQADQLENIYDSLANARSTQLYLNDSSGNKKIGPTQISRGYGYPGKEMPGFNTGAGAVRLYGACFAGQSDAHKAEPHCGLNSF